MGIGAQNDLGGHQTFAQKINWSPAFFCSTNVLIKKTCYAVITIFFRPQGVLGILKISKKLKVRHMYGSGGSIFLFTIQLRAILHL